MAFSAGVDVLGIIKDCYYIYDKCQTANAHFRAAGEIVKSVGNAVQKFERNARSPMHLLNRDSIANVDIMQALQVCKRNVSDVKAMVDKYDGSWWQKATYDKERLNVLISRLLADLAIITEIYSDLSCRAIGRVELRQYQLNSGVSQAVGLANTHQEMLTKVLDAIPNLTFEIRYWDAKAERLAKGRAISEPWRTVQDLKESFAQALNAGTKEQFLVFTNKGFLEDSCKLGKSGFGSSEITYVIVIPKEQLVRYLLKRISAEGRDEVYRGVMREAFAQRLSEWRSNVQY